MVITTILGIDEITTTNYDAMVVIDVCRAFTTAAFAFQQGVKAIYATDQIETALQQREMNPGSLLLGEVNGLPVPGFDLWNSPCQVSRLDLRGRILIQRTSSGTQGLVRCRQTPLLYAASFPNARATMLDMQRRNVSNVAFIATGRWHGQGGEEDVACAQYMTALLNDSPANPAETLHRGRVSVLNQRAESADMAASLWADLTRDFDLCFRLNCVDFTMQATALAPDLVRVDRF